MTTVEAFIAANRFGLGPRLGRLDGITPDPQDWLLHQLGTIDGAMPYLRGLPLSRDVLAEFMRIRKDRDARKRFRKERARPLYRQEAAWRTMAAIRTDTPFRERLVQFWGNHFTASVTNGKIRTLVGPFEREVVRPNITGRFADMLISAIRHPAMLVYLDNISSVGPNSRAGIRRRRGLNENLAREILELHTLGVDGGYSQADIIALAKILTGWSFGNSNRGNLGEFTFFDARHEPGNKLLLGRTYQEEGVREGEAALHVLAVHPSTAHFIAMKLARHFVADEPPPRAVNRLRRTFIDSNGDLGAMARTLVTLLDSWKNPLAKVKTPNDLVVSAFRLLGSPIEERRVLFPLRLMGQLPYFAPSPAGWPDKAESWIGPESLLRRIEFLELLARRFASSVDPERLAADAIGPVAGLDVVTAIERAGSRREALALLLTSREFQRR